MVHAPSPTDLPGSSSSPAPVWPGVHFRAFLQVENPLGNTPEKLGRAHHRCQQTSTFTHAFSQAVARGDPLLPRGQKLFY